jgi:tetratricopeptide (TPR) repeat protein
VYLYPCLGISGTSTATALQCKVGEMSADQEAPLITRPQRPAEIQGDPATFIKSAWEAFHSRDWDEAGRRWALLRQKFPDILIGHSAAVTTLREAGRLDDADAMAEQMLQRFPNEPPAHCEQAWLIAARGNHPEAAARWAEVRQRFPNEWVAYFGGARALRETGDTSGAEALLGAGAAKFPTEPVLLTEFASAAVNRRDWVEASRRWATAREHAPNHPGGYTGGARSARELGRYDEADMLLRQAMERLASDATPVIEYAWVSHIQRDWSEAIRRWEQVRTRFPDNLIGYTNGAQALRSAERFDEAESVLLQAAKVFPNETGPVTELAWLAFVRRDFEESVRRWDVVRDRFPNLVSGYLDTVHPLRSLKRTADAERILIQAVLKFPGEFAPAAEIASIALARRDWEQAGRLYAILRDRFPNQIGIYGGSILALRELRRFDDAEAVAAAAVERFPAEVGLRIDQAWLAQVARNWPAAINRWAAIRQLRPDFLDAYIQAARAMRSSWRHEEAETLMLETMQRFPDASEPAAEYASIALQLNRWDDAQTRFQQLRERFPAIPDGWQAGAAVLRHQFQFAEAETMLEQAMARFPGVPQFVLDHAQMPVAPHFAHEKNWPETLRRLDKLQTAFPSFEAGFVAGVRALNDSGQPDQAEALARSAGERLPDSYALAIQYAQAAEDRRDWPQAFARYAAVRDRFTDQPGGEAGLARALAGEGRFEEAEAMLRATMARFPTHPAPFAEYAEFATRQEKWADALERWTVAQDRFPQEQQFAHRAYEARMRLTDADPAATVALAQLVPAPMPDPDSTDQNVRDLVMQFESLGGRGLGCEFGIFQRDCGAEPLGLLRWADMPYNKLLFTLRNRFEGVGSPEHTELFVSAVSGGRGEYCTTDRRGMMFMRVFVYEDQAPFEKMQVSAFNRLRFLTRKLIDDLEEGSKIFVFRLTDRDLTTQEIDDLHAAMRAYGNNTLLYVRYETDENPNGTVEAVREGLLVGYMDRFKLSRTDQLSSAPPTSSWLAVCRNAYALWRAGAAR